MRTALIVLALLILPGCQVPKVPMPPVVIQADVQPVTRVTIAAEFDDRAELCAVVTAQMLFDHPEIGTSTRVCFGTVGDFRALALRTRMAD